MSRNENGRSAPGERPVPSIPLSDADLGPKGEPSIGNLVKDATASVSTLVRSEVALAKSELITEAKKAGAGTGALVVAGVTALYASFFFFFFLAELLSEWLPRWAAFLIVFGLLVIITVGVAFAGYLFFKKVRGPKKTIETVKEIPTVLPKSDPPAKSGRPSDRSKTAAPDPALAVTTEDHPQIPPAREG
ncbi:phage holin family protein [Gordonia sp. DT30]|uniref:phage holin family protein n=1 Tax=Gordonia sp. DT30 TaxID=3416546 RepID=UPI003CEF323C